MVNITLTEIKQSKKQKLWIEIGAIALILIVLSVILPFSLSPFRLQLLGRFLALAIVALGIDLIWGYTGLLSLGHGIFFALGGYAFVMHLKLQIPEGELPEFFNLYGVTELPWFWQPFHSFIFSFFAVFLIPAFMAGLLGYLVFRNRIKGVYFSILTQAALIVFYNFFNGQQKLINGTNGLKIDKESIFGFLASAPSTQVAFYQFSIFFLLLSYLVCRWLTSGRFGRLLIAIRDDENRVRFSGYDPTWFKVLVFAISGAIAGIAGALYSVQTAIITPSIMEVAFSIEMVIWVAVGGRGTLLGAIIGTLLVRLGQSFLSEQFPDIWLFFQGALFLIVVTILPNGIVGWWNNWALIKLKLMLGLQRPLITYPSLENSPDIDLEKQEIDH